jgi:hypothetical protein
MSKTSRVYVIVVLEDSRHEMLVRRYLKKKGMGEREMRIERSPSGRGSAEGWVRKTFLTEVNEYRRRQAKTALLVVIDADTRSVQDRWNQLDGALEEAGKQRVNVEHEQIARLVPKRNIETWILCLNGNDVDEEADYKKERNDWSDLERPNSPSSENAGGVGAPKRRIAKLLHRLLAQRCQRTESPQTLNASFLCFPSH